MDGLSEPGWSVQLIGTSAIRVIPLAADVQQLEIEGVPSTQETKKRS